MLLKGAYCVGEHFVDPQRSSSRRRHHSIITHIILGIRIAFLPTFCKHIITKPLELGWDNLCVYVGGCSNETVWMYIVL